MANSITIKMGALLQPVVPTTIPATANDGAIADARAKGRLRIDARAYSVSETSDAAWREALDQWRAQRPQR